MYEHTQRYESLGLNVSAEQEERFAWVTQYLDNNVLVYDWFDYSSGSLLHNGSVDFQNAFRITHRACYHNCTISASVY